MHIKHFIVTADNQEDVRATVDALMERGWVSAVLMKDNRAICRAKPHTEQIFAKTFAAFRSTIILDFKDDTMPLEEFLREDEVRLIQKIRYMRKCYAPDRTDEFIRGVMATIEVDDFSLFR